MADDILFSRYEILNVIEKQRHDLRTELDQLPDSQLLGMSPEELQQYAAEKYHLELPALKEPSIDEERTKMSVGRWGGHSVRGEPSVEVDAQRYTLEVPFDGDGKLFYCRGSKFTLSPPSGSVSLRENILRHTLIRRDPTAEQVNQEFERFLADIQKHLDWLREDVEGWNKSIKNYVDEIVHYRRERAEKTGSIASQLKFPLKPRNETASTYAVSVTKRQKINPQLPTSRPGAPPEPFLADAEYRSILDTLRQMASVMEKSPHAWADMDEEALRFSFLIPLNANFEGEARAEVFNYTGKTDILIASQGRNIFIAECKFWKGQKTLSETVDQILGYLAWRDTKCAILLFSRNHSFSKVLQQVPTTMEKHPQFVSHDGTHDQTEMHFTFKRKEDEERKLKLAVLAFDIPTPST